jgi:hypothetical protein
MESNRKLRFGPALAALALCAAACAALNLNFIGKDIVVTVPSEIPFPDAPTLVLEPRYQQALSMGDKVLGAVGGGSVEQALGRILKDQTVPLRREGAESFLAEILKSGLFKDAVYQGGNVGFSVGVSKYGVAYDASSGSYRLLLELEAQLSQPQIGVVWTGKKSVDDLSPAAKAEAQKIDLAGVMARPESLHRFNQYVVGELSRQMVEDLKQHPPAPKLGKAGLGKFGL